MRIENGAYLNAGRGVTALEILTIEPQDRDRIKSINIETIWSGGIEGRGKNFENFRKAISWINEYSQIGFDIKYSPHIKDAIEADALFELISYAKQPEINARSVYIHEKNIKSEGNFFKTSITAMLYKSCSAD